MFWAASPPESPQDLRLIAGACFAPFYFTWKAFACFFIGYAARLHATGDDSLVICIEDQGWGTSGPLFAVQVMTGMLGITLSYHRQLAHLLQEPKGDLHQSQDMSQKASLSLLLLL